MIYTVVCTDINDYVNWQFELLEYSWSRIKQPGKLIRLVACDEDEALPVHKHAEVVRTRPTNKSPVSDDTYVCYNRLYSLQQWLSEQDIQGSILIVDADVVFRSPLVATRDEGSPLGQHWVDYWLGGEFREALEQLSDLDLDALQPVTWPALIDANDLRKLLPRWIEATVSIREHTKRQESDMFGFLIAALEQDLIFELGTTTAFMPWPEEKVAGAPIIHYCQVVEDQHDQKLWAKTSYQPWQRVANAQTAKLPYCRDLLELVDEFARLKAVAKSHRSETIFIAIAAYCEPELVDTIQSCLNNARRPENLRFGICLQYDNTELLTSEHCLDEYAEDTRFRFLAYPYTQSRGGCWARNLAQQLYANETYTLQIDAHTQMIESWDSILIEMMRALPAEKPLITQFPPLYSKQNGHKDFQHIEDLTQVNTSIALRWNDAGWLDHTQRLISANNTFPRYSRLLSGAFVFTLGIWNQEVRQDPKHFYTGEEFALAVRSFTHGYDLFDPNQIVCWHRFHPEPNRKFWSDNSDELTNTHHNKAIARLKLLFEHNSTQGLGRYGLGTDRTLEEFAEFSGIDCINKTLTQAAISGERIETKFGVTKPIHEKSDDTVVDITVTLKNMPPFLLSCYETTPVLASLFQALQGKSSAPNDLVVLELGENGEEQVYFKAKQLVSIESNPPLSDQFFSKLMQINQAQEAPGEVPEGTQGSPSSEVHFNDSWRIWIWSNVARGVSKDEIFKELINNGFSRPVARQELGYEPSLPLNLIDSSSSAGSVQNSYQENPIATRIDNPSLQIYFIDNFLTAQECDSLMTILRSNLKPSAIADNTQVEGVHSKDRNSSSCSFDKSNPDHTLATQVASRLAKVIGINEDYAEPIQGQLYRTGGEYKSHYDWFEPGTASFDAQASVERGGQRTWSVIVYLNDVVAGGETKFERAELTLKPKQGRVVFWNNLDAFGAPSRDVLHQACPVLEGEKAILTLWFRSLGKGEMYLREPYQLIPRYTERGFDTQKIPVNLFAELADYYQQTTNNNKRDEPNPGGYLENSSEAVPTEMIDLPEPLRQKIITQLRPYCEKWSQSKLEFSALYGLRVYKRGTSLKVHTDIASTHIISVILNVSQQSNTDWMLELYDHYERQHQLVLMPGEMLFYEGARLRHGRPTPFDGEHYANIFLHFRPLDS